MNTRAQLMVVLLGRVKHSIRGVKGVNKTFGTDRIPGCEGFHRGKTKKNSGENQDTVR